MTKKEVYINVALHLLHTRMLGSIKGSAEGLHVCESFLSDVALLSEAIVKGSEQFEEDQRTKVRESIAK